MLEHDFVKFPELRSGEEFDTFYFVSPHRQITEDFRATVVKVHDGDTVSLRWNERDFVFPLRLSIINAPELSEEGGHEAKDYLEGRITGHEVDVLINPDNRVEKWGRLLGQVVLNGIDMGEELMNNGMAKPFDRRDEDKLPNLEMDLAVKQWF